MAKLSQQQLDKMAQERKKTLESNRKEEGDEKVSSYSAPVANSQIISEIMGDENTQLYKYTVPNSAITNNCPYDIPFVAPYEYPSLNIKGKVSRNRHIKAYNLFLNKEIDYILKNNMKGKNKNAALNFLIWVGLQTLKGIKDIDILVHDDSYADGERIVEYIEDK